MTGVPPRVILKKGLPETPGASPFWSDFRRRASDKKKTILFPEGDDPRVVSAAAFLSERGICRPLLAGDPARIAAAARSVGLDGKGFEILNPAGHPDRAAFAAALWERRKAKGLTPEAANALMDDALYFSAMALRAGLADGFVGGAVRSTADTVRAAFAALPLAPGADVAFGAFFVECPFAPGGARRLLFADAAVSPHPSPRALAAVGIAAAALFARMTGETPRVAFLSFSTLGSAEDDSVTAVRQAVASVKKKAPGLAVDGELQGDAALVDHIAAAKGVTDFSVAGRANVLIFPDLNAGNIAYKLVQHLGGARAAGPLIAGLSKPLSDLSRGCTDEDIVDAAALVSLL